MARKKDFDNVLKVLNREVTNKPVLFEFFLNDELNEFLLNRPAQEGEIGYWQHCIDAFAVAGYDYGTVRAPGFSFPINQRQHDSSLSLNEGAVISDEESFEKYHWPVIKQENMDLLKQLKVEDGMKLIAWTPGGILENTINLMGFDNLCINLYDNRDLVRNVVDKIGGCLLEYFDRILDIDLFGAAICNDDWGFNTTSMIDPDSMREFIVPWTTKFVELIHSKGRPAIQHSCGNHYTNNLIEDIIEVCKFDAHHSFEDKILPIEEAYAKYHNRIALLGGIDVDFLCRSSKEDIIKRCNNLLDQTAKSGAFALGSGNSIPAYVPNENYFAMIDTVKQRW